MITSLAGLVAWLLYETVITKRSRNKQIVLVMFNVHSRGFIPTEAIRMPYFLWCQRFSIFHPVSAECALAWALRKARLLDQTCRHMFSFQITITVERGRSLSPSFHICFPSVLKCHLIRFKNQCHIFRNTSLSWTHRRDNICTYVSWQRVSSLDMCWVICGAKYWFKQVTRNGPVMPYDGVNIIFRHWPTVSLAVLSTDNLPIDLFVYMIALQGKYEIAVSVNIHALIFKSC